MLDSVPPPGYLELWRRGELSRRAAQAGERLAACDLCGHRCGVDRRNGGGGICRTGINASVHGHGPHHGEEDCLRGWNGSGTIFFSRCNLRCVFCQNWETSQLGDGEEVDPRALAAIMLSLQDRGCHNINLVSPSHVIAPILASLSLAAEEGLRLPLVYNTGGYDNPDALRLLEGVIDIYMPDMKYGDPQIADRYSSAPDYCRINQAAVREMHRQVGDLELDAEGLARRGLLVRHLVLPAGLGGTEEVLRFLAREVSPRTFVNLMDQYRPCYRARENPPLDRRPEEAEFLEALATARAIGLRLDPCQGA